jgi:hypothetical protein
LKSQDDFRNAFPKSEIPDKTRVFRLVAVFTETGSVSGLKRSGRPTVLSDVSVGKNPTFFTVIASKIADGE